MGHDLALSVARVVVMAISFLLVGLFAAFFAEEVGLKWLLIILAVSVAAPVIVTVTLCLSCWVLKHFAKSTIEWIEDGDDSERATTK